MNDKKEATKLYLAKAKDKLSTAKLVLEHNHFDDAVSRAYYVVFLEISAVLFFNDREYSSHSQTIGNFNKDFINGGTFPKQFGRWIYKLFEYREVGDYSIRSNIDKKIATESVHNAEVIYNALVKYIDEMLGI